MLPSSADLPTTVKGMALAPLKTCCINLYSIEFQFILSLIINILSLLSSDLPWIIETSQHFVGVTLIPNKCDQVYILPILMLNSILVLHHTQSWWTFFLSLTIMYPTQHKYSLALISAILAGWGSKFYK